MSELEDPRSAKGEELTDGEKELMRKLFGNWLVLPDSFKASLADYVSQNSLIPVSQVRGFSQTVAKQDLKTFSSGSNTTSTTYVSLSTACQLTELEPGQYIFLYGFNGSPGAGGIGIMAPEINASTPANDDDGAFYYGGVGPGFGSSSVTRAAYKTLTASTNTVELVYRSVTGSTFSVTIAFLIALRIANA